MINPSTLGASAPSPTPRAKTGGSGGVLSWVRQNKGLVALVALLSSAVGLILYFQLSTPLSPPTITTPAATPLPKPALSNFNDQTYSLGTVTLADVVTKTQAGPPNSLVIYQLPASLASLESPAQTIAKNENLQADASFKNYWSDSIDGTSLSFDPDRNVLIFTTKATGGGAVSDFTPTETDLIDRAKEYLQEMGLETSSLALKSFEYVTATEEPAITTRPTAQLVRLVFTQSLDTIPVVLESAQQSTVWLLLSTDGALTKMTIYPFFTAPKARETMPRLGVEKIVPQLDVGNFTVLAVTTNARTTPPERVFVTTQLHTLNLEYRLVAAQQLYYPHYRLAGAAVTAEGRQYAIDLITPAVAVQP